MLYLESSALVKHYVLESGTNSLNALIAVEESAGQLLFTSSLTFAEVHHAFVRKFKDKTVSRAAFDQTKRSFETDWTVGLTIVELGSNVLLFIPEMLERTNLRSSDAIQLASALWLRDFFRLSSKQLSKSSEVILATSDVELEKAAATYNLKTFNPQTTQFP